MAGNCCCLIFVLITISCASAVVVTPTSVTDSNTSVIPARSSYYYDAVVVALYDFTEVCQFNFSYTSDQPVSVWLSLEPQGQSLLVLPDGRPCVNETACKASKSLNPQHRYFLLAETTSDETARMRLNITAAASSESGCGTGGPGTVPPVLRSNQYVSDNLEGPVTAKFTGAECLSYLAVGYMSGYYSSNSFDDTADVDGFVTTNENYLRWADDYFPDGTAVRVANSTCSSDVPYCTATVKGLNASETYVLSVANGYDDRAQQSTGIVYLAYSAGSKDACEELDVAQFFSI